VRDRKDGDGYIILFLYHDRFSNSKRVLAEINKNTKDLPRDDNRSLGISYVDEISVKMQSHCIEEINYKLEDFVEKCITEEYKKLNTFEQLALDLTCIISTTSHTEDCFDFDYDAMIEMIKDGVFESINSHYLSKKVRRLMEHYEDILEKDGFYPLGDTFGY
jgi:hypothetical protein